MRLKKQSMRQIADAGMVSRNEQREVDSSVNTQNGEKPRYFRGALVKTKPETKTNGDES
jgi:hypothetical protein